MMFTQYMTRRSVATATVTATVMRQGSLSIARILAIIPASVAQIIQTEATHIDQQNDVTFGMWKRI